MQPAQKLTVRDSEARQRRKKIKVIACFIVSRFRQNFKLFSRLFSRSKPTGFTKARANRRKKFYWAAYNNGHYSSAHIQQKVQESKRKPVSELSD
jgi:NAD-dependent SIR2 family protein deacetylase